MNSTAVSDVALQILVQPNMQDENPTAIQILPTELICDILERTWRDVGSTPWDASLKGLRPVYPILQQSIVLSQICRRWRTIALSLPYLWEGVCLRSDTQGLRHKEVVKSILSRTASDYDLDVDIESASDVTAFIPEEDLEEIIVPHLHRIYTMRLLGPHSFLSSILDMFTLYNLSMPPRSNMRLSRLHIFQTPSSLNLTFPFDLTISAPYLELLFAFNAPICAFPVRYLRFVRLIDIFIPRKCYYQLFSPSSRVQHLGLVGVTVPSGYMALQGEASIEILTLMELRALDLESGPEGEDGDAVNDDHAETPSPFPMFFASMLLPTTLLQLNLVDLAPGVWDDFMHVLGNANPPVVRPNLEALNLLQGGLRAEDTKILADAFPMVKSMVIEGARSGDTEEFIAAWRSSSTNSVTQLWPLLMEMKVNGEVVAR